MSTNAHQAEFRGILEPIVPVAYFGGVLILIDQLTQVLVGIAGFDPGQAIWRFQTAALLVGRVSAMSLGLLLILGVAQLAGQARPARLARTGFAVVAGLLILALVSLWVDGPAVKQIASPGELQGFVARWIRVLLVGLVALLIVGGAWMQAKRTIRSS
ncbi:MAG: hypothetical protein KF785_04915 [Gemmatimonadales bacterium]|nr:hypothetical protein [Gemmatimonadales bacterium]